MDLCLLLIDCRLLQHLRELDVDWTCNKAGGVNRSLANDSITAIIDHTCKVLRGRWDIMWQEKTVGPVTSTEVIEILCSPLIQQ
jgi:hypothetical protein